MQIMVKKMLLFLVSTILSVTAYAQNKITGTVADTDGNLLPGVVIQVSGTKDIVTTDQNGNYTLTASSDDVLKFQCLGYVDCELKVGAKTVIDVKMQIDNQVLEEAVAVGYGYVKRSDVTGAISSLKSEDIVDRGVISITDAFQGKMSGVMVMASDGAPGANSTIQIRGSSSINASNAPLYVIDGFPVVSGSFSFADAGGTTGNRTADNPLSMISPSDIESIEILKDASSTAIYGSRGANGVILVTTKKSKAEKPTVSYQGSFQIQFPCNLIDVADATSYGKVKFDTFGNMNYVDYNSLNAITNTDWQKEVLSPAFLHDHQVSLQAGSKSTKYNVALNYLDQDGTFMNTGYKRLGARINTTTQLGNNTTVNTFTSFSQTNTEGLQNPSMGNNNPGLILQALYANPTLSLEGIQQFEDDDEMSDMMFGQYSNPVTNASKTTKKNTKNQLNVNAEIIKRFLKNFEIRVKGGLSKNFVNENSYWSKKTGQGRLSGGKGMYYYANNYSWINENILSYNFAKGKSSLNVMAGLAFSYNFSQADGYSANSYESEYFMGDRLQDATEIVAPASRVTTEKRSMSYFARTFYSYANRYILSASVRRDASSVFGDKHKWGTFPAASFAWKMNEESWLKNIKNIDLIKLRVGWGMTGNDGIPPYSALSTMGSANTAISNDGISTGLLPSKVINESLKWETTQSYDIGFDLAFFQSRLTVTADYYLKKTKDMLLNINLPTYLGYQKAFVNKGSKQNYGIELSVNSVNIAKRNFEWTTSFNISFDRDKVIALGTDDRMPIYIALNQPMSKVPAAYLIEGEPIGLWWGLKSSGIYQIEDFEKVVLKGTDTKVAWKDVDWQYPQNYDFVLKEGVVDNELLAPRPGNRKYVNVDNDPDNVIDENDRTIIGRYQPLFYGGLTNEFRLGNFRVSVFLNFKVGGQILNANRIFLESGNGSINNVSRKWADNRWTPPLFDENDMPIPDTGNPSNEYVSGIKYDQNEISFLSDDFLEDASYLRISNLTFTYNFPEKLISKIKLNGLSMYLSANNLYCFSRYTGYDPDVNTGQSGSGKLAPGLDLGAYPRSRTLIFGLKFNF